MRRQGRARRSGLSVSLYVRAFAFTVLLPGSVAGLVPWRLHELGRFDIGPLRFAGLALILVGGSGLLYAIWEFASVGRGTLAPVDPPTFVVRTGLYRWVRNPMYVANVLTLSGEGIFFESTAILVWGASMAVVFHMFVVLYEERALVRRFGDSYDAYCRTVPRWIPRRPATRP